MVEKDRIFPSDVLGVEKYRFEREIRDPLYDYIHITSMENELIDSAIFQRLDRIYQNPVVRFVYPNATHTRKAHSLGVMHLYHKALLRLLYHQNAEFRRKLHPLYAAPTVQMSGELLDNLEQKLGNDWWDSKSFIEIIQVGRIAALLHDVGHGPFSHLFEFVSEEITTKEDKSFRYNHEKMSALIVKTKLKNKLSDSITVDDILTIMEKRQTDQRWFLREILDGPFDVDKLDYINRDSYHAGTKEYGTVDYERIIDGFRVKGEKLLISKSAIGALMSGFNALQLAYTNIYYHKTCRIFDHMIIDALRFVPNYVKEIGSNVDRLLETDDITFLREVKYRADSSSTKREYEKCWQIINDVLNRKKRYYSVFTHQVTFDLVQSHNQDLSKLKDKYEPEFEDIRLVVDYTGAIKGLRIDPVRTFQWLTEPSIIDESDKVDPIKNLNSVSGPYFNTLRKYQILFYLFVDRKIYESGKKQHRIRKAVEAIRKEIEEIEKRIK